MTTLDRVPSQYDLHDGVTKRMSVVVALLAVVAAGVVSWLVVRPGDSLFLPLVIDVAIFAVIGFVQKRSRPWHRFHLGRGGNLGLITSLCVASVLWTYFGVLTASVDFDTAAASTARHDVAIGVSGCQMVRHGSVGFIDAPYQICTTILGSASIVDFTKSPSENGGYSYITGQSTGSWFPDGCARHLIGHWWAYASSSGTGCALGYGLQGGG